MKKYIIRLFTIVLMLIGIGVIVPADETLYYGDINCDNIINAEDALHVLKHSAKLEIIDSNLFNRADVNGNKSLDSSDALEILKYAAGIIEYFTVDNITSPTEIPVVTITPIVTPTSAPVIDMPDDFSGKVWILGDSIAAYHNKEASIRPLYGWGEVIGDYFNGVTINNHAISSQSTSSYYSLKKTTYDYVFYYMKENDYAFISFGHNDHNSALLNNFDRTTNPEEGSDVEYSYKWWLKNYYIDPVLERGAVPILISSVVRWYYEDGAFVESDIHMKYGKAMEELVEEYAAAGITVYYIDAQDYTYNLYSSMNSSDTMLFHGQYGGEGRGFFDNTHYSEAGARMISEYIVSELKKTDLSIVKLLKPEFAPPKSEKDYDGKLVDVANLNNVAVEEGNTLRFLEPTKTKDGIEMVNPFADKNIDGGVTISFWFKPVASYFSTDKGYTPLLVFVNSNSKEMLKLDAEGTYHYSDDINKFKATQVNFAACCGNEYFITCVIDASGIRYYADGKLIKVARMSGSNEEIAYSKLLPLLTASDTEFYVGGNDSLYFMAAVSAHELKAGTTVRDLFSYTYPMTSDEVQKLYEYIGNNGDTETADDFSGNVWIIGDSIAAYHDKTASVRPLYGWGELIGEYFSEDVRFYNMGISSQSTSSYYTLRRPSYDYIFDTLEENDYVIISFGHNDHNPGILEEFNRVTSPDDGSETELSYKWWLKNYYIDPVLKKGAVPILMSSVVRCTYKIGSFYEENLHLRYGKAMEELVDEYANEGIKIYFIDAQDYTYNLYKGLSEYEAKLFHGQYGLESGNYFDNTHYSEAGARMLIDFLIEELEKNDLSIVRFLK